MQRFVPQSDLLGLNPIWTTGFVVGNAAYMTYDTMYAIDSSFYVRPQMPAANGGRVRAFR